MTRAAFSKPFRQLLYKSLRRNILRQATCISRISAQGYSTHYDTLGISKDAKAADIKKAYIEMTKTYHPDVVNANNADDFLRIAEAYEVLGNPQRRREYDFKEFGMSSDYNRFESGEYNIPLYDSPDRKRRYEQSKKKTGQKPDGANSGFDKTVKMALSGRERAILDYLMGALISICLAMYFISRYQRQNSKNKSSKDNECDK